MFIGFSKTLARFGGFRLGVGFRITKKNFLWMSMIVLFACIFKLMWYMLLLCGWLMYAMFYGIYWCIKQIIKSIAKSKNSESKEHVDNMTDKSNIPKSTKEIPPENNSPNNKPRRKASNIVRWILGVFFALFVFVGGFHYSSVFFILAAFLMLPFGFIGKIQEKLNIKTFVIVIASIVLFFIGIFTFPASDTSEPQQSGTSKQTETTEIVETTSEISTTITEIDQIITTEKEAQTETITEAITETAPPPQETTLLETESETETEADPQTYIINYSATTIESNSVGDTWSYGVSFNSKELNSGSEITVNALDELIILLFASEEDAKNSDYGSKSINFDKLSVGESKTLTIIVTVKENDGRYKGNEAKCEFIVTYERIN